MKKFFTLIAAALMAVGANADTKTFSMATKWSSLKETQSPITVEFATSNTPQTGYMKFVKATTFTVSSTGDATITGLKITATATNYNSKNGAVSVNVGQINHNPDNLETTWSGSATSITIGNGLEGYSTGGDWRIASIEVTYTGGVVPPSEPTAATTWDFTVTSDADSLAMAADANWTYTENGSRFQYANEVAANTFVDLGEIGFPGGAGIQVARSGNKLSAGSSIRVDVNKRIQLNASNGMYRFPTLAKNDVVKIRFANGSTSEERTFTVTNGTPTSITATISTDPNDNTKQIADKLEAEITVTADGPLTLTQSKPINIFAIAINTDLPEEKTEEPTGIKDINAEQGVAKAGIKKYIDGKKVVIEKNGKKFNLAGTQMK